MYGRGRWLICKLTDDASIIPRSALSFCFCYSPCLPTIFRTRKSTFNFYINPTLIVIFLVCYFLRFVRYYSVSNNTMSKVHFSTSPVNTNLVTLSFPVLNSDLSRPIYYLQEQKKRNVKKSIHLFWSYISPPLVVLVWLTKQILIKVLVYILSSWVMYKGGGFSTVMSSRFKNKGTYKNFRSLVVSSDLDCIQNRFFLLSWRLKDWTYYPDFL